MNKIYTILTSGILVISFYTFGLKDVGIYYKLLVLILALLIIMNSICYKKIKKLMRESELKKITFFVGVVIIILLFLNVKYINIAGYNLAEDLQEISDKSVNELRKIYNYTLYGYIFILIYYIWYRNIDKFEKISLENVEESFLFSFREKELKKMKELIDDDGISSILINAKMGNGKTKLIEYYAKENPEIIYLKLPLIKNLDELKINLFSEIKSIFTKYDIESKFLNDFVKHISTVKTNFFEIGLDKNINNWENIMKLKKGLLQIEKKQIRVIIVLDDIERESSGEKIEEFILFLGELSEYFRNTKVTILFLANCEYIKDNCFTKNKIFLEKYFSYELKLKEPNISKLPLEDIEKIFREAMNKGNRNNGDKKFDSKKYIKLNARIVKIFFEELKNKKESENINENYRNLTRAINKITFYKEVLRLSKLYYVCLVFFILIDIFDVNKKINQQEYEKLKKEFFLKMLKAMELEIKYVLVSSEISNIEKIYLEGEFTSTDIETNIDKIIKIFTEDKLDEQLKITRLEEEIISDYIGNDRKKLEIALEKNLIRSKSILNKKLLHIDKNIQFNENIVEKIRQMYLVREYTALEEWEELQYEQREQEYYCLQEEEMSYEDELKAEKNVIIEKLKNIKISNEDIEKIEKILEEDMKMKIYEHEENERIIQENLADNN